MLWFNIKINIETKYKDNKQKIEYDRILKILNEHCAINNNNKFDPDRDEWGNQLEEN